ncbi:hypothetical protein DLM_2124 [Aquitalea magnusonii]|uniref:Uncharacterized protein n=1 Tax=Aquitalea magnusonii TaxID=332411 RepID=A0A3G9GGI3_9NEIS|nr:hypothetical protein DLM_2124 [Aquitalea magnusonii]
MSLLHAGLSNPAFFYAQAECNTAGAPSHSKLPLLQHRAPATG